MRATYAVKWREADGQTYVGRLALAAQALRLEGRAPEGPPVDREIAYALLRPVRVGHRAVDRLDGLPALLLERADGSRLIVSGIMGAGILHELADRLSELRLAAVDGAAAGPGEATVASFRGEHAATAQ